MKRLINKVLLTPSVELTAEHQRLLEALIFVAWVNQKTSNVIGFASKKQLTRAQGWSSNSKNSQRKYPWDQNKTFNVIFVAWQLIL